MFEPCQPGFEILDLPLDVFELLRSPVSAMWDIHLLVQYLIMLDDCVHPTEGGLEGREPIGRLFRHIEEDL